MDLNRIPNAIAFCATAPGVRRSFVAAWLPESLSFAKLRSFFTSSAVQARETRRFCFFVAIITSLKDSQVYR
jgi:hypothetical protein